MTQTTEDVATLNRNRSPSFLCLFIFDTENILSEEQRKKKEVASFLYGCLRKGQKMSENSEIRVSKTIPGCSGSSTHFGTKKSHQLLITHST